MPRKSTGQKLEKVVSTKISVDDFKLLEKYAKTQYNRRLRVQPIISQLLRRIIKNWAKVRHEEGKNSKVEWDTRSPDKLYDYETGEVKVDPKT